MLVRVYRLVRIRGEWGEFRMEPQVLQQSSLTITGPLNVVNRIERWISESIEGWDGNKDRETCVYIGVCVMCKEKRVRSN